MAVDVVMPQMGESIFEGTITKWLKKPGDKVERDEPLFEISTDKVDAEIPSPTAGVLKEIKIPEGHTVPIQTVVAVIDGAGTATVSEPTPAPAPAAAKPAATSSPVAPAAKPAPAASAPSPAVPAPAAVPASAAERIHSSPLVRRLAKEHGVDLASLEGTGAGGRRGFCRAPSFRSRASRSSSSSASPGSSSRCSCCSRQPICPHASGRRTPRAHLLRQLRNSAAQCHAPENRRAHGCFEARLASCLFC